MMMKVPSSSKGHNTPSLLSLSLRLYQSISSPSSPTSQRKRGREDGWTDVDDTSFHSSGGNDGGAADAAPEGDGEASIAAWRGLAYGACARATGE